MKEHSTLRPGGGRQGQRQGCGRSHQSQTATAHQQERAIASRHSLDGCCTWEKKWTASHYGMDLDTKKRAFLCQKTHGNVGKKSENKVVSRFCGHGRGGCSLRTPRPRESAHPALECRCGWRRVCIDKDWDKDNHHRKTAVTHHIHCRKAKKDAQKERCACQDTNPGAIVHPVRGLCGNDDRDRPERKGESPGLSGFLALILPPACGLPDSIHICCQKMKASNCTGKQRPWPRAVDTLPIRNTAQQGGEVWLAARVHGHTRPFWHLR